MVAMFPRVLPVSDQRSNVRINRNFIDNIQMIILLGGGGGDVKNMVYVHDLFYMFFFLSISLNSIYLKHLTKLLKMIVVSLLMTLNVSNHT